MVFCVDIFFPTMIDNQHNREGDINSLLNIHWFPLASQGNIYSMSKCCSPSGINKILVASLKRKIYCFDFHKESKLLRPIVKELLFTYIPNGAEIISIDGYNKQNFEDEFVIGITIIKPSGEGSIERYLNIYSESAGDGEVGEISIETIAQNCLTMELTYTPYLLYHTLIFEKENEQEIVWLISGNDNQIHMIREDKMSHGYIESQIDQYFPEFVNLNALALWISIYYYDENKRRLTAIGCECGLVKITMVDTENSKILKEWKLRYETPVSSVRIFSRFNERKSYLSGKNKLKNDEEIVDILIVNALNSTIVFMDVLRCGLKNEVTLTTIENSDCILSSCIADINMDGANEILLGTYSHEIFVFSSDKENKWKLSDKRKFDAPVYSMCYLDITGDGMKELIILTQTGVYILQHNPEKIRKILEDRLTQFSKRLKRREERRKIIINSEP